jgi:hypothetical protein
MTMQANADYAAAKQMVEKLAVNRPPVQAMLDKTEGRTGRHRAAFRQLLASCCHRNSRLGGKSPGDQLATSFHSSTVRV